MRIADRLKEKESFTPTENQIAEYILENSTAVPQISLDDFSEQIYVSKSTIIRFCKKLGFRGFKELCVELARDYDSFMSADTLLDVSFPIAEEDTPEDLAAKMMTLNYRGIADTYRDLDMNALGRIAERMYEAEIITVFAQEQYLQPAEELERRLSALGFAIHIESNPNAAAARCYSLSEGAVALFITYDAKEASLIRCARILSERRIPVCLLSGPTGGSLLKYADEAVQIGYYEPSPRLTALGSRTGIQLVCDILFALLFHRDYARNMVTAEKLREIRKQTEAVFSK